MAVRLAAVLMWFATLRMGELTNQLVAQFDPSFALLRRDVMVAPNGSMACLRLRKGKPDKTNSGTERFITAAPPGAAFCPVRFLQVYLDATPHHSLDEPLLVFSGGPRGQRRWWGGGVSRASTWTRSSSGMYLAWGTSVAPSRCTVSDRAPPLH